MAEYWPTITGMMAITVFVALQIGGGVKNSYCTVIDALGDEPVACETGEDPGDPDPPTDPEESHEPPAEATCVVTLSSAAGTDPSSWNSEWFGDDDVIFVNVEELDEPVSWSLKLRFPTDPNSVDTEIDSGTITESGQFEITVPYPEKGDWGPPSSDGYGTYESHATLHIQEPCGDVGWDRWYKAEWTADLGIDITHDVSPVTVAGETLTYTVTVTNNGPHAAQVYNGEGTIVELPAPPDVTVLEVNPSEDDDTCDTQIVCDLGAMDVGETKTIEVVTTVPDPGMCELTGTANVSASRPPDPDMSNNEATTNPFCEPTTAVCVDYNQFGVATGFNAFTFDDFYAPHADTEGRLAAGGDVDVSSYTVGLLAPQSDNVLIAGNNLTYRGGSIHHGDVVVGGVVVDMPSWTSIVDGELTYGTPIDFASAHSYLNSLSSALANTEANGTTEVKWTGSLRLTGTDEQLNVFDINGSQLGSAYEVKISIPEGSTALINVSGGNVQFSNGGYWLNGSNTPSSHGGGTAGIAKIVYNLPDATTAKLNGGISGSVLAPNADVTFPSGVLWGTIISKSFSGGGQLNHVPFQGCIPPVTY